MEYINLKTQFSKIYLRVSYLLLDGLKKKKEQEWDIFMEFGQYLDIFWNL